MMYFVKVQGRQFEVEIGNLHTQPIVALVDGEYLEIWLEQPKGASQVAGSATVQIEGAPSKPTSKTLPATTYAANGNDAGDKGKTIRAPIPGTIISVGVSKGTLVTTGQDVCVLEAMKMKNSIRSPRSGIIAEVYVIPGQTVQHHDILVEFTE